MTQLSDYLDLLEPSSAGTRYLGALTPPAGGVIYRPPAKYTVSRTAAMAPANAFRYVAPRATPAASADPAADRARADCVAMCAANPASPDCRPDAPGQPGSGGFCAAWLPGGSSGTPAGGGVPTGWTGPPAFDPTAGSGGGIAPTCPEGSFWDGAQCVAPEPDPTAAAKPWWPWVIAAAVAWKILRR